MALFRRLPRVSRRDVVLVLKGWSEGAGINWGCWRRIEVVVDCWVAHWVAGEVLLGAVLCCARMVQCCARLTSMRCGNIRNSRFCLASAGRHRFRHDVPTYLWKLREACSRLRLSPFVGADCPNCNLESCPLFSHLHVSTIGKIKVLLLLLSTKAELTVLTLLGR